MWHVFQFAIVCAVIWAWETNLGFPDNRLVILVIVAFAICMAFLATKAVRAALDLLPHRRNGSADPAEQPAARLPKL
jgi:hypothetical protein